MQRQGYSDDGEPHDHHSESCIEPDTSPDGRVRWPLHGHEGSANSYHCATSADQDACV
jgi:hypothetical protein